MRVDFYSDRERIKVLIQCNSVGVLDSHQMVFGLRYAVRFLVKDLSEIVWLSFTKENRQHGGLFLAHVHKVELKLIPLKF